MTHLGLGAWTAFRDAVAELSGEESEHSERALVRNLRIAFSDFGHVDFFTDASRRWRVLRPALVGLSHSGQHLFVGGRTRSIMERIAGASSSEITVTTAEPIPGLTRVQITGGREAVSGLAQRLGIEYVVDGAALASARISPIRTALEAGPPVQEPINWSVRSWSFQEEKWVEQRLERTVREYSNRHGVRRYLVNSCKAELREIEKRTSMYCAALVRDTQIASYSASEKCLRVPLWAPLPEMYSRAACLAGGRLGAVRDGKIDFEGVDHLLASTLLVGLGQGFPRLEVKR
jgi:hypothetical protein